MLQVARLAPNLLCEARDRVADFINQQLNDDGGFKDRSGESDLYYTVFGLEGLTALRLDLPSESTIKYLQRFGDGADLDLVHLSCLARCWANFPSPGLDDDTARKILDRFELCRSADGGYSARAGAETGTVYNCFLAFGAYQDLKAELPESDGLLRCIESLRTPDGAYANERSMAIGTTPTTAAAVTMFRQLGEPIGAEVGEWLLARCQSDGGFLAMPQAPMPDLLSTATALHALVSMHVSIEGIKEVCLDFLDTLWTGQSFCGHWSDDELDCEYTYYALLALGHLSL